MAFNTRSACFFHQLTVSFSLKFSNNPLQVGLSFSKGRCIKTTVQDEERREGFKYLRRIGGVDIRVSNHTLLRGLGSREKKVSEAQKAEKVTIGHVSTLAQIQRPYKRFWHHITQRG